jgi:hypothetical protein
VGVKIMVDVLVSLLRLLLPFTILRWPLLGGILCMLADAADVMLFEQFGYGFWEGQNYHTFDKFFDIYYLFFEYLVARRWTDPLARRTGQALFFWRLAGFIFFELTQSRYAFFLAPNIFEFFYLGYLIICKFKPRFQFTTRSLIGLLLIVGIPNIIKEYYMHFLEFETWAFMRDTFFWWLY